MQCLETRHKETGARRYYLDGARVSGNQWDAVTSGLNVRDCFLTEQTATHWRHSFSGRSA